MEKSRNNVIRTVSICEFQTKRRRRNIHTHTRIPLIHLCQKKKLWNFYPHEFEELVYFLVFFHVYLLFVVVFFCCCYCYYYFFLSLLVLHIKELLHVRFSSAQIIELIDPHSCVFVRFVLFLEFLAMENVLILIFTFFSSLCE